MSSRGSLATAPNPLRAGAAIGVGGIDFMVDDAAGAEMMARHVARDLSQERVENVEELG
jgi:hypothetical protein